VFTKKMAEKVIRDGLSKYLASAAFLGGCLKQFPLTQFDGDDSVEAARLRRRVDGTVGVWLDAASRKILQKHYPKLKDVKIVLLQSPDLVGSDIYEPLYGAVSSVKIVGTASASDTEALTVQVSLPGLGGVDAVGLPSPIIGGLPAVHLVQRLQSLGVIGTGTATKALGATSSEPPNVPASSLPASWCGMVPIGGLSGQKELIEFTRRFESGDPKAGLQLSGIICPSGLYEEQLHTCSWDPTDKNDIGVAPTECPLCAYIKEGGCKEAFLPFQECLEASVVDEENAKNSGDDTGKKRDCMPLFKPVVDCMQSTSEKRAYYKSFMGDFSHLFRVE